MHEKALWKLKNSPDRNVPINNYKAGATQTLVYNTALWSLLEKKREEKEKKKTGGTAVRIIIQRSVKTLRRAGIQKSPVMGRLHSSYQDDVSDSPEVTPLSHKYSNQNG